MITTILFLLGINFIDKCNYGYYIDVKSSYYAYYEPLEKITLNYLQFDCNE